MTEAIGASVPDQALIAGIISHELGITKRAEDACNRAATKIITVLDCEANQWPVDPYAVVPVPSREPDDVLYRSEDIIAHRVQS